MKKIFIVATLFFIAISSFAQNWEAKKIADKPGDTVGTLRLNASFNGTFSDEETTNGAISAYVMVGKKDAKIIYMDTKKFSAIPFFSDKIKYSVKDSDGEKINFTVSTPKKSTSETDITKIIPLLKKGGQILVVAECADATYRFTIDASKFPKLFEETF
jgi:hypothetical protein